MSHFCVVVIGNDVDEQLAPYAEQNYEEKYGVFNDTEEENLKEYLEDSVEIVILPNGEMHNKYAEQFRKYNPKNMNHEYLFPEGSIVRDGKFTELYKTFEEFMESWHGNASRDEINNRYGYWNNPNARWDWYSVGGRWTGYFKPKAGTVGTLGRPGAFDNKPTEGWVDSIQLKDVDIEAMKDSVIKEANETYDKIESILKGRIYPSWEEIRNKHGEDIQAARDEYNNHEIVKDFNKESFHIWGDFYEEYANSREEYINKCKNKTMVPYAVVKNGQWYQKGEMGWWGMSSNEMTQDEWNTKFWEMINSLEPETQLTLIDCHI